MALGKGKGKGCLRDLISSVTLFTREFEIIPFFFNTISLSRGKFGERPGGSQMFDQRIF